jgi:hypothetical protein
VCHVALLIFERPILVAWVRGLAAGELFDAKSGGWILIVHPIVNIGLGALYSAQARPRALNDSLAGCGLAAGLPNMLCTATGAWLVVSSELPRLSERIGISLPDPAFALWLAWTILAFSTLTGIVAAPLGVLGGYLAARVGGKPAF